MAQITVTGVIKDTDQDTPSSGKVTFTLNEFMIDASNEIIPAGSESCDVNPSDGTFSIALNSTLDSFPSNRFYNVTFVGVIDGADIAQSLGTIQLAASPSSVTLASLIISGLAGGTAVTPTIAGAPAELILLETSQTLPAGLWRLILSGDHLYIQRNTAVAGDFSSVATALEIDPTTYNVTVNSGALGVGRVPTQLIDAYSTGSTFVNIEGTSGSDAVGLLLKNNTLPRQWSLRVDNNGLFAIKDDGSGSQFMTASILGTVTFPTASVGVGGAPAGTALSVSGGLHVRGVSGGQFPSSGVGIELTYNSTTSTGYIQSFARTGSAWKDLIVGAKTIQFTASGTNALLIDASQNVIVDRGGNCSLIVNSPIANQTNVEFSKNSVPQFVFYQAASQAYLGLYDYVNGHDIVRFNQETSAGQVCIDDGTNSLPSLCGINFQSTGLYWSTNQLNVTVAGNLQAYITSAGVFGPASDNGGQSIGDATHRWSTGFFGNGIFCDNGTNGTVAAHADVPLHLGTNNLGGRYFRFLNSGSSYAFAPDASGDNGVDIGLGAVRFRSGYFGSSINIGDLTGSPTGALYLGATGTISSYMDAAGTGAFGSKVFRAARGTLASPTIVANGDVIGEITSSVYNGSAYGAGADIQYQVDGTPTSGQRVPTRIAFFTTPLNGVQSSALVLKSNQQAEFADGAANAPSISFINQPGGGFWYSSGAMYASSSAVTRWGWGDTAIVLKSDLSLGWASGTLPGSLDTILIRDGANTLAMQNGANAQEFRVYGTTTGPKYGRLFNDGSNTALWSFNSDGGLYLGTANGSNWFIDPSSKAFVPTADATSDLGSTSDRVRNGYFSTSVNVGVNTNATGSLYAGSNSEATLFLDTAVASASSPSQIVFRFSRGTQASRSDPSNGDQMGSIVADPFSNGTAFPTAEIRYVVDGTFTTGQRPPSRIEFYTNAANGAQTKQVTIFNDGGVTIGAPTGNSEGSGTLNVSGGVFKNGTAYTNPDYGFEHFFTGTINKYASHSGASKYKGLTALEDVEDFARENYYLPQLDVFNVHNKSADIFDRADASLLLHEEAFLHLIELNKKCSRYERAFEKLGIDAATV